MKSQSQTHALHLHAIITRHQHAQKLHDLTQRTGQPRNKIAAVAYFVAFGRSRTWPVQVVRAVCAFRHQHLDHDGTLALVGKTPLHECFRGLHLFSGQQQQDQAALALVSMPARLVDEQASV